MSRSSKSRVVYDDERINIVRRSSGGKKSPAKILITMKGPREGTEKDDKYRTLYLSTDELFDLTEVLDDLCDYIEDSG